MNPTPTDDALKLAGLGPIIKAAEARDWQPRWYQQSVALNRDDKVVWLMWCDHLWTALCLQEDGTPLGDTDDCDVIEKLRRVTTWLDDWAHAR